MADTHVTITGNLTDDPELKLHPQRQPGGQLPPGRHRPGQGRRRWRDGDTSSSASTSGGSWPSTSPSRCPRATGRWSSAGSSPAPGRPPRATAHRWSRSRPTRSPRRCAGPPPSPSAPPTAGKGKGGQFNDDAAVLSPGSSEAGAAAPVPASRTTSLEEVPDAPPTLPDPTSIRSRPCICWAASGSRPAPPAGSSSPAPAPRPAANAGPPAAAARSATRTAPDGPGHHPHRRPRAPQPDHQQSHAAGAPTDALVWIGTTCIAAPPPPCGPWPTPSSRPRSWPTPTTPTPTPSTSASGPSATRPLTPDPAAARPAPPGRRSPPQEPPRVSHPTAPR